MNHLRNLVLSLLALPLAYLGCTTDVSPAGDQNVASVASAIVEGSPEAVGVLNFLNASTTTLSVLDDDVPLHATAAANLIAHRDGPDATFGTADDDSYDDLAEVLSVNQVGPARLQQIADYVAAQGLTPTGDDVLGTYDGVTFTVNQAEAVLLLVNTASYSTLDDDVPLDKRAVDSIFAARPIASVLQLSQLYWVGTSALNKLIAWISSGNVAEGEDCASTAECQAGLSCQGIPFDGSPAIGKCVDLTPLPGQGDPCGIQIGSCNTDLECVGMTVYSGEGYCRPLWMVGRYESEVVMPIPDNNPTGVSSSVVVYGLATVPEDIVVTLDIDHTNLSDLVVTLYGANGSSAVLWNHTGSPDFYLPALCCIDRDDFVNGTWTLEVVDTVSGNTGTLNGYSLLISSRFD